MTLLNLRKSKIAIACLFILQLSIVGAHPVRSSGTADTSNVANHLMTQRVTRNDPYHGHQQSEDKAEVVPPFDASSSEPVTMGQETTITESSLFQEEINPFILVADEGAIFSRIVPEPLEIVTPSFLDVQDAPVTVSEVEPVEKLEDPSIDTRIVAESFDNSPVHSPFEAQWPPVAPSDSVDDVPAAPTDLPFAIHSLSTFEPISNEAGSFQKLEEASFDPLVVFPSVSNEAELIQKIEDLSFDPTAVPVSNEPEWIHNVETHSLEPLLDDSIPVLNEESFNPNIFNPSIDSFIVNAPVPEEAVSLHEDHSAKLPPVNVPISDEAQPVQNIENSSGNPTEVAPILVQDVAEVSVDTRIVTEPVTNILADPSSQVATEKPQSPPVAPSAVDFLPQAVFISTVLPASTITIAPFKLQEPVSPSLYSVTSPKKAAGSNSVTHSPVTSGKPQVHAMAVLANLPSPTKTELKSYPSGQQLKQQSYKQSPVYGKVKTQSNPILTSSLNPQIQINQSKYQVTSSTPSPATASGPPRATLATSYGKNNFSTRPFGSSPKPRQLGFPPVSNTRDNVLLQVNWAANLGRPYRST